MSVIQETSTEASRIFYIDSRFGTNRATDPQITTDIELQLQDSIVVPNHHGILLSVHRLNVPRSFYNFKRLRNAGVEIIFEGAGGGLTGWCADFTDRPTLTFELPEGNYNAISLMNYISDIVNDYLQSGISRYANQDLKAVGQPRGAREVMEFNIRYNADTMKYSFRIQPITEVNRQVATDNDVRITFRWLSGLVYGADPITIIPSAVKDSNIRNEFGFIKNRWVDGDIQDFFVEFVGNANNSLQQYRGGYGRCPETAGTWGNVVRTITGLTQELRDDFIDFWEGSNNGSTPTTIGRINYFSCVDVNFHSGNLYLHTNLTSNSVIDSKIGCRYSDILARIPVSNVEFGDIVEILPSDGAEHKVILKVREITQMRISLRDLDNELIDLNGLDWNLSLRFDFIEMPKLEVLKDKRLSIEEEKYKNYLEKVEGKKGLQELKEMGKREAQILNPNV